VARGWTAASFAIFVAAFSHTIAGGTAPSLFGIAVALVISSTICTMLTGRTVSLWRLLLSVGLSQVLFHWLFSGLGTPIPVEHSMATMPLDATATHHHPADMWLAHAVAAVITIIALRYAGSAFWGVAEVAQLVFARLAPLRVPVIPTHRAPTFVGEGTFVPRDLALLLSPMRHRGPPLELA
jgi:hypothetical protein